MKKPLFSYTFLKGSPDRRKWDFRVLGMVEEQLRFSYEEFRALPTSR